MDGKEAGLNAHGLELLCEIVREHASALPCPGCGQALRNIDIEPGDVTVDQVTLEVTCLVCQGHFGAIVVPASDGGVAIVS